MTDPLAEYYFNRASHTEQVRVHWFHNHVVGEYPHLGLFRPNATRAPWHWQSKRMHDPGGFLILLNFWPHKLRAQLLGYGTRSTYAEIEKLIDMALDWQEKGITGHFAA